MKFTKPEEPKAKAKESTIEVEVGVRDISALQVRTTAPMLVTDLMKLLNHGSTFAEHCSLVHGIGGLEGIFILKSILKDAELEPDTSILDRMLQEMKDKDADELHILMIDYDDATRMSVDATIKTYFKSAGNDFKPKPSALAEAISKAGKVGSIDDLVAALEAKLNLKGKK